MKRTNFCETATFVGTNNSFLRINLVETAIATSQKLIYRSSQILPILHTTIFSEATTVDLVHESILSWSKLQALARSRTENQTNAAEPELQAVAAVHDKPSSKKMKSLSS